MSLTSVLAFKGASLANMSKGDKGDVGPIGPQGAKGDTGAQGPQGPTGATGPTGPSGNNGIDGVAGATGPQGAKGDTGPQGIQGLQGLTGPQGLKGDSGADGESAYQVWLSNGNAGTIADFLSSIKGAKGDTGAQGPQGMQGVQGIAGATGASGINYITDAYSATRTYVKNDALHYNGSSYFCHTTTTGNLPTDNSYWHPLSIMGATGPQGPQGVQGEQGEQGIQGTKGDTGANGADGLSAYQVWINAGNAGTQADFLLAIKGAKGDTGAQGIQGLKGDTGAQGPKGDTGATGPQGPQGLQGETGPQGTAGPQGIQGATGLKGDKGDTGLNGANGDSAYQIWLDAGHSGTESEFLASLIGQVGDHSKNTTQKSKIVPNDLILIYDSENGFVPKLVQASCLNKIATFDQDPFNDNTQKAYYSFDSQNVNDESYKSLGATTYNSTSLTNIAYTADGGGVNGAGRAMSMFNNSAYSLANLPTTLVQTGNLARSVSMWVKLNTTERQLLFGTGIHGTSNAVFDFEAGVYNSGNVTGRFGVHFWGDGLYSGATVDVGVWTHIVVTHAGGNLSSANTIIYKNGVAYPINGTATFNTTSATVCAIGYRSSYNDLPAKGLIDQVRVFHRALTPTEVNALYIAKR